MKSINFCDNPNWADTVFALIYAPLKSFEISKRQAAKYAKHRISLNVDDMHLP